MRKEISPRAESRLIPLTRFSGVARADRILVLSGGKLIEEGSHARLMALGGTYARMFRVQAAGYLEGAAVDPADGGSA